MKEFLIVWIKVATVVVDLRIRIVKANSWQEACNKAEDFPWRITEDSDLAHTKKQMLKVSGLILEIKEIV